MRRTSDVFYLLYIVYARLHGTSTKPLMGSAALFVTYVNSIRNSSAATMIHRFRVLN